MIDLRMNAHTHTYIYIQYIYTIYIYIYIYSIYTNKLVSAIFYQVFIYTNPNLIQ